TADRQAMQQPLLDEGAAGGGRGELGDLTPRDERHHLENVDGSRRGLNGRSRRFALLGSGTNTGGGLFRHGRRQVLVDGGERLAPDAARGNADLGPGIEGGSARNAGPRGIRDAVAVAQRGHRPAWGLLELLADGGERFAPD